MMTLKQYLASHELSQADFARQLSVPEATVSRWVAGKMIPRRERMREIEDMTAGAVTPASWFSTDEAAA